MSVAHRTALTTVMDGLTAVRELRAAEAAGALNRSTVIALTGNARQGQIDQAIAGGMDDGVSCLRFLDRLMLVQSSSSHTF